MANTIRIKRRTYTSGGNSGAPAALSLGELAFNDNDRTLYIGAGSSGGDTVLAIAGDGLNYVTTDTVQTVTGNKTFSGTTTASGTLDVTGTFKLDGTTVSASAAELNLLDDVSGLVKADFTKLAAVDATAVELNKLDGATASTTELNYVTGVTSGIQGQLNGKQDTLTFGINDTNAVKIDHASVEDNDYAKFTANGLEGISSAELRAELGAVTSVSPGALIDVASTDSGATQTVSVDLTELADMTAAITGSDEFVVLDVPATGSSVQKRKAASEIPLSIFNNDLSDTNTTYDLSVPASTTKINLAGSDSTNDFVEITGGSNVTVTRTSATKLTVASSFTNTTYTAESNGGLVLNGTEFRLDADNMATHTGTSTLDAFIIHPGGSGGYENPKARAIDTYPISGFKTDVDTSITGVGTITTGTWAATDIAVAHGGTGASSAAGARTNLGVDAAGTDNSTNVTLTGTPDYITISGQQITRHKIDLTADVTGALPSANVGNLPTSKITSGTFLDGRIKASNVTQHQDSITSVGTLDDLTVTGDVDITAGDLIVTAGNLIGPSTFYIDPAPNDSPHSNDSPPASGTVVIRGDLQVDGTTTTINSTQISIADKHMRLAEDQTTHAGIDAAGILLGKTTGNNVSQGVVEFKYVNGAADADKRMALTGVGGGKDIGLHISGGLYDTVVDGGTF